MSRPICGFKDLTGPMGLNKDGKAFYPKYRWDGQPKRVPKKGEYFISGAIPQAYKATSDDMTDQFFIAVRVN